VEEVVVMMRAHDLEAAGGAAVAESGETEQHRVARERIERRRKFWADVVAYLLINALLVGIWALGGGGYFWPIWVILGWGAALSLDAYQAFVRRPVTESDIRDEMSHLR
jgi:hypothetical protein